MLISNFQLSLIFFPLLLFFGILISKKVNFVDKPNLRKIHDTNVVNPSGVIIYIYLFFVTGSTEYSDSIESIIVTGLIVVIIGFIDDRIELKPISKLVLLIFPIGYLILNGFELNNLGYYEYVNVIHLGKVSIIFTFLAVILLTNAINYLDGTDGLLIGYTITAFLYFYYLSNFGEEYNKIFLIYIYLLAVSLIFNLMPHRSGLKSFIGDSGSLFAGFFISFIVIYLYKFKGIHPGFLIWACWLPVFDFLYVTFYRMKLKRNFSNADKSHLHHHIFKFFKNSHIKTFFTINFINIIIILIGYCVCLFVGKIYSLILFVFLFIIFTFLRFELNKFIKLYNKS